MGIFPFLETLWQDIRYGLRQLRRNRGFAAAAILTLALGIGANTAIFSVVDALMLRPLPYPQPDRIVHLYWKLPRRVIPNVTVPEYKFWRDSSGSFQSLAGIQGEPKMQLKEGSGSEWVDALRVTDGFFRVFGVRPAFGRGFVRAETQPGAAPAVVLANRLWRNVFHSDAGIIGRQIVLNGKGFAVVGVLPPGFTFTDPPEYPDPPDLFLAMRLGNSLGDQGMNTEVIGRLKSGISLAQANAEMPVLADRFRAQAPATQQYPGTMELQTLQSYQASGHRAILLLLFGAVGLLLLIACANVASLLLARATGREREIAIRLALGAEGRRLLGQFLAEGLLLGLAGAAVGLAMGVGALRAAVSTIPWELPATAQIQLDGRVLVFTLLIGIGASIVFALIGFFRSRGTDWSNTLKEGRAVAGLGRRGGTVLKLLVIGEVAVSLMLALGAGLLLQSLYRLYSQNLGFDPTHIVTITTAPWRGRATGLAALADSERQALGRIRAIPGVESAAMISTVPLGGGSNFPCQREGHSEDSIGGMEFRIVSPGYFATMKIPVLRGRGLAAVDSPTTAPVAVIDESLAREWWPGANPLGGHIVLGEFRGHVFFHAPISPVEVVGVVGDTRMSIEEPAPAMIYMSIGQMGRLMGGRSMSWVVRARPAGGLGAELRRAFSDEAPELRIVSMRTMAERIGAAVAQPRFNALLLGMFGGLALALTLVGISGVLQFQLSQRVHEIGVRVALGAGPGDVGRVVVGQAMKLAGIGVLLGIGGATAIAHLLSSLLYKVKPLDPIVYAGAAALLLFVAFVASYVPARRAMRVNPVTALKHE